MNKFRTVKVNELKKFLDPKSKSKNFETLKVNQKFSDPKSKVIQHLLRFN